jgi:hypothetical protein
MNDFISKKTRASFKSLGFYQITGGTIGIFLVILGFFNNQHFTGTVILIFLFIIIFFGYSIYCGFLCLQVKHNALKFSLINQIFQVIGFAMFGLAFKYVAGVYFTAGLNLTESFKLLFEAGVSNFEFKLNIEKNRLEVDFNFVALSLIIYIERLKQKVQQDYDNKMVSSIGEKSNVTTN